ncbi:hypothetical protein LCGC14_0441760 [marine sediment metagenome]|uniref:Uncharacterized protein n=1 Tax=marine sediment metagenome TaxID=412755 RepID=A0A0F9T3D8_9ZZZZ
MKHSINTSFPDETHYTIAVLSDDEEERLKAFLKREQSEEVKE